MREMRDHLLQEFVARAELLNSAVVLIVDIDISIAIETHGCGRAQLILARTRSIRATSHTAETIGSFANDAMVAAVDDEEITFSIDDHPCWVVEHDGGWKSDLR